MWWWPAGAWNPLASLIGANLVLLCVGWPLAIFLFALAAMWGVLIDHATWGAALDMAFWRGALPATLAMALGYVARLGIPPCPPSYLLARGLLIPFAVTVICGFASLVVRADFAAIGDAAPAAITLVATLDAVLTGMVVMSLVLANPRALATWSDELYLGDDAARTAAAMRSSLEPHAAPASALKQRKNQP